MSKNTAIWTVMMNGKKHRMTYAEYLATNFWFYKRLNWIYLFRFRCAICNAKCELRVHHRIYTRLGDEIATDAIAMCPICHNIFHQNSNHSSSLEILNPIEAPPLEEHYLSIWGNRCAVCNSTEDVGVHFRSSVRKEQPMNYDAIALCGDCNMLFWENGRIDDVF